MVRRIRFLSSLAQDFIEDSNSETRSSRICETFLSSLAQDFIEEMVSKEAEHDHLHS